MFYYKTSFSKKTAFFEKTHLWEDMTVLAGGGRLATKNQYNLFCRHRRLEYFSFNKFFEKNNIFQNNDEKLFFGGA